MCGYDRGVNNLVDELVPLTEPETETRRAKQRGFILIAAGLLLLLVGTGGLFMLLRFQPESDQQALPFMQADENPGEQDRKPETPDADSAITGPDVVTALPEPTLISPPTALPTPTQLVEPTALAPTIIPVTPPEIVWTQAEINALGWTCYGEVGGMVEVRVDACWSVISTVRARYAYSNSFPETDVMGTLLRPGQFNITVHTDRPGPDEDLNWAVLQYQTGARGSCNGYLYFDSVPGGPSLCVIRASNGQWIEFHNGWN